MGQKVNPKSYRISSHGIFGWTSKWYAKKNFPKLLQMDVRIRKFLMKNLREAMISKIEIEMSRASLNIIIHAVKPGLIIGRAGAGVEKIKKELQKEIIKDKKLAVSINIVEVRKPFLESLVVVQSIAFDLEKRIPFRRAMKQAIARVQKEGALGVKVIVGGRLNGAEIARSEMLTWGKIPLHTLRANIDYSRGSAFTTYGALGIKVWIYKGDVFNNQKSITNN